MISTRWAPTSYKWDYNHYKWPYKWVAGVIAPISGVMTPFITSRGPPCRRFEDIHCFSFREVGGMNFENFGFVEMIQDEYPISHDHGSVESGGTCGTFER